MTSIFYSGLSKDLSSILCDADDFNVIIQVGKDQDIKEFRAHSVILRARSPYFKNVLSTKYITNEDNMIMLNKSDISPKIFDKILKYIYTGELDLEAQSCEDVLDLLTACDELHLEELFKHAQDYIVGRQSTWVQQNLVIVLHTVYKLTNCKRLQDYCNESIYENPQLLITSKDFPSLDKDILHDVLRRDDLQIEEVVVWECLVQWGIKQTPCLGSEKINVTKWSNKEYEALRDTLSQFIPLIRFLELSTNSFYDKVRPFKFIFPNTVYEEVETFYCKGTIPKSVTLLPRTRRIESKIINSKLSSIIARWIDRKVVRNRNNSNNSRYKFELSYRGNRDGIDNVTFKNKCKGQVASLVLIKVQQSDKIFGGYSSIGFNSSGKKNFNGMFYYASDNFIFSFENSEDIENMKISRVVNHYKAIMVHEDNGFNFGQGSLCMDGRNLYVCNDYEYYENNLSTKAVYTIEEIETFAITKL